MGWGVCSLRSPYSLEMPLLRSSPFFFVRSRRLLGTTCSVCGTKKKNKEKVIVISGPTGAGKSRLALELAKRLNGEVISADSVQVYRGLDVGSAKPSLMDHKEVPHHLVDVLHPSEGILPARPKPVESMSIVIGSFHQIRWDYTKSMFGSNSRKCF